MKPSVLIIDDEVTLRKLMTRVIELEGYAVQEASNLKEAQKILKANDSIHIVICDVRLPDGNGVDFTGKIKKEFPAIEVLVLTAHGSIEDGVTAIKNGAFDYLTKGNHQDKLIPLLSKASEKAVLQQKVIVLENKLQSRYGFESILGNHPSIKQAIELAQKVSVTNTSVLLLGETGTGKEVFAQSIHYASNRKSKSFVALNCSAFAKDLLENELFGHAEGAFTGATKAAKGYLEEAHEGTLFLDEIGEMNIDLQAKLLRVLETGEFYRVGESKPRKVNVRFIAATNRNLLEESEKGNFRSDLYYRLSVFTITLPALRERKGDIKILANYFINQFALKTNKRDVTLSDSFLKALEGHAWKGNIRELKNVIERSVILSGDVLSEDTLPSGFAHDTSADQLDLASVEQRHIRKVLAITGGNKTQTAKVLGIGLTTLYQKLKDYGIQ